MLDTIVAKRLIGTATTGRTKPMLISGDCTNTGGRKNVEVYAKLASNCDRGIHTLATEALCAMLGSEVGLPVPEPFVVSIDAAFVDLATDNSTKLAIENRFPYAFGSKKLPDGYFICTSDMKMDKDRLRSAFSIFVFDVLMQNVDRRSINPNCLTDGKLLGAIDHDLALLFNGVIGWKPPWEQGGADFFSTPDSHVFYRALKGHNEINNFLPDCLDQWSAFDVNRLRGYLNALPIEWIDYRQSHNAFCYLEKLFRNIDDAFLEVERVLA